MDQRFYFAIQFLPEHADYSLLAGRCIATFHGFINANNSMKNKIGVSFPRWNETTVGNMVAFVGNSSKDLIGLSYQPYFSRMKAEGLFELSNVLPVPNAMPEVQFVRNQTIGKMFVKSKKRRINRSLNRNLHQGEHNPESREHREFDHFHRIPIASYKSEQEFILHVQKRRSTVIQTEGFSSYGMATNEVWQGTVPDLVFDPFK